MTTPNVPKWSLVKGDYGIYYAERASDKARLMLQSSPSKSEALIASLNAMPPDPSISAAEQRATDAEALLEECEWCIPNAFDVPTSCPLCWGSKNTGGHAPDCRLAAFLARTKGATDGK